MILGKGKTSFGSFFKKRDGPLFVSFSLCALRPTLKRQTIVELRFGISGFRLCAVPAHCFAIGLALAFRRQRRSET